MRHWNDVLSAKDGIHRRAERNFDGTSWTWWSRATDWPIERERLRTRCTASANLSLINSSLTNDKPVKRITTLSLFALSSYRCTSCSSKTSQFNLPLNWDRAVNVFQWWSGNDDGIQSGRRLPCSSIAEQWPRFYAAESEERRWWLMRSITERLVDDTVSPRCCLVIELRDWREYSRWKSANNRVKSRWEDRDTMYTRSNIHLPKPRESEWNLDTDSSRIETIVRSSVSYRSWWFHCR